ncbi:hypothetical protein [Riemerella columbipharyngis]|uniref:Uncharacterized protein n=1 Tax=Riemerella columbipharyngis TaxID=1071918 RepID=A0A1G6Y7C6_9FLAO|nr:hypothetical protein [Riemerella columbipharyngis]SDD86171.1 hypothetical protein SAMN05421544_10155 [Riemerella columbipharyngis]
MKKILILIILGVAVSSCRKENVPSQKIEQVLNIYVKNSTGKDLLNPKDSTNYISVSAVDLNADIDGVQVPLNIMQNDSIYFLQYIAGARRILKDSLSKDEKTYSSDIVLSFNKNVNQQLVSTTDTLGLEYFWSPSMFRLSDVKLNNVSLKKGKSGNPTEVVIVK